MVRRCKLLASCQWIVFILLLSNCALPRAPARPVIDDDLDAESLRAAIRHSLVYLDRLPPDRIVGAEPRKLTAAEVRSSLIAFEQLLNRWSCRECLVREIAARFELIPSNSETELSKVLFTGYYQPVIEGSLVATEVYRFPIYAKPLDLMAAESAENGERIVGRMERQSLVPYYTRREIDELGVLKGRGLEIAWVRDPIDVFFLHIQGSGIIRLPDGAELSVGYAAQNGLPYRSIGRLLIDRGEVAREEMSMQRLRQYLNDNPQERDEIFSYNESYVFFRMIAGGPLGSLEVPVTAGRSIATDYRLFPKGALVLVETEIPVIDGAGRLAGWRPMRRFMLNQDTGGAIRGFQRADIYFGTGEEPGGMAGYMNRPGRMFFLMLKNNRD
jgi:membrane-bound lytic murein transglycosylase A